MCATISAGLFLGFDRVAAARFSFLLSIPAVAASGLLEMKEAWRILPAESFTPLAVATGVAAIAVRQGGRE